MRGTLIVIALLLFVGGCGAGSPSGPVIIPTSIEYSSADAVVVGSIPGASANISKSSSALSFTPTKVYAYDSSYGRREGTIAGSYFYLPIPVNRVYGVVLTDEVSYAVYQNLTMNVHSVPLIFVTGASASGRADFVGADTTDTNINIVNIGEVQFVESASGNVASKSPGSFKSTADSTLDFTQSLNYPSGVDVSETGKFDPGFLSLGTPSGNSARIFIAYDYYTTSTVVDSMNAYINPDTFGYWGYSYFFVHDPIPSSAELIAPVTIRNADGGEFTAGTAIPSCNADFEEGVLAFFCTGVTSSVAVFPVEPAQGDYRVIAEGVNFDFLVNSASRYAANTLVGPPIAIPKLIVEGGYITGIEYKWVRKLSIDSSWYEMTKGEVAAIVRENNFAIQIHGSSFESHLGTDWNVVSQSGEPATGRYIFSEHGEANIAVADVVGMHTGYMDISGYGYGFEWMAP